MDGQGSSESKRGTLSAQNNSAICKSSMHHISFVSVCVYKCRTIEYCEKGSGYRLGCLGAITEVLTALEHSDISKSSTHCVMRLLCV